MDDQKNPVMNVMQLLHGAYNIQNWNEVDELREIWDFLQGEGDEVLYEPFKRLEKPVMTRW